jgi:hypothetical protein
MPKQVLASHLGMTGEILSRLLAKFEEDNLAASECRKLRVLSIEDMKYISEFGRA